MALDPTTPVIKPPSTLDLGKTEDGADAGQAGALAPPEATAQTQQVPALDLNPFGEGSQGISRYDTELVRQAGEVIDRDLARAQRDAEVSLAEQHSSRGTVGSSIESWSQQEMLTNLETERMRRLTNLEMEMANVYAEDRATAANIGLAQRAQQIQQSQFERQMGFAERSFDDDLALRTQALMQDAQLQGRALDITEARNQALGEQFNKTLTFQYDQLSQQLGIERERLQQDAFQFKEMLSDRQRDRLHQTTLQESQQSWMGSQAELDRALTARESGLQRALVERQSELDRALQRGLQRESQEFQALQMRLDRDFSATQASLDRQIAEQQAQLNRDQQRWLQDNSQQFATQQNSLDRAMQTRENELDRLLQQGLQRDSFEFRSREAELDRQVLQAESSLDRAQQEMLQTKQIEFQGDQARLDRLLETRALDLQRQGLDMEDAWRTADRELDERLASRAEALQREGMDRDDAWRQAMLDFDHENLAFQRDQQSTNEELARWDIYLRALAGMSGTDVDIPQEFLDDFFGRQGDSIPEAGKIDGDPFIGFPGENWWPGDYTALPNPYGPIL